ncbi:MAG: hypothetical protein RLZZ81_476 [Pseudomonadota bacterium]|jgi:hypothetical protein
MSKERIELREASIWGIAGHKFWVRYNDKGQVIGELHGFGSGDYNMIGSSECSIEIAQFPSFSKPISAASIEEGGLSGLCKKSQNYKVVATGKDDVAAKWELALKAIPILNKLEISYDLLGGIFAFKPAGNCNSVAKTLADIMDVQSTTNSHLWTPGSDNNLLPEEAYPELYNPTNILGQQSLCVLAY